MSTNLPIDVLFVVVLAYSFAIALNNWPNVIYGIRKRNAVRLTRKLARSTMRLRIGFDSETFAEWTSFYLRWIASPNVLLFLPELVSRLESDEEMKAVLHISVENEQAKHDATAIVNKTLDSLSAELKYVLDNAERWTWLRNY